MSCSGRQVWLLCLILSLATFEVDNERSGLTVGPGVYWMLIGSTGSGVQVFPEDIDVII